MLALLAGRCYRSGRSLSFCRQLPQFTQLTMSKAQRLLLAAFGILAAGTFLAGACFVAGFSFAYWDYTPGISEGSPVQMAIDGGLGFAVLSLPLNPVLWWCWMRYQKRKVQIAA
jgi:hypothetical protein